MSARETTIPQRLRGAAVGPGGQRVSVRRAACGEGDSPAGAPSFRTVFFEVCGVLCNRRCEPKTPLRMRACFCALAEHVHTAYRERG